MSRRGEDSGELITIEARSPQDVLWDLSGGQGTYIERPRPPPPQRVETTRDTPPDRIRGCRDHALSSVLPLETTLCPRCLRWSLAHPSPVSPEMRNPLGALALGLPVVSTLTKNQISNPHPNPLRGRYYCLTTFRGEKIEAMEADFPRPQRGKLGFGLRPISFRGQGLGSPGVPVFQRRTKPPFGAVSEAWRPARRSREGPGVLLPCTSGSSVHLFRKS